MKTGWLAIIITSLVRTNGFVLQQPKRLKMSHILRDSADDIRFAAQFDPGQAAASLSIFFSFIIVQNRINNSNILLAKITDTKKELKTTKAEVLGGVNGAVLKRDTLEGEIVDLEAEWMKTITFVSIPGMYLFIDMEISVRTFICMYMLLYLYVSIRITIILHSYLYVYVYI